MNCCGRGAACSGTITVAVERHAERGEQRGVPLPFVIPVRHGSGAPGLIGSPGWFGSSAWILASFRQSTSTKAWAGGFGTWPYPGQA